MDIPLWVWYFGGAFIFLAFVKNISNVTQNLFILLEDIRDELRAANEADYTDERVEHRRQTEMSTEQCSHAGEWWAYLDIDHCWLRSYLRNDDVR